MAQIATQMAILFSSSGDSRSCTGVVARRHELYPRAATTPKSGNRMSGVGMIGVGLPRGLGWNWSACSRKASKVASRQTVALALRLPAEPLKHRCEEASWSFLQTNTLGPHHTLWGDRTKNIDHKPPPEPPDIRGEISIGSVRRNGPIRDCAGLVRRAASAWVNYLVVLAREHRTHSVSERQFCVSTLARRFW